MPNRDDPPGPVDNETFELSNVRAEPMPDAVQAVRRFADSTQLFLAADAEGAVVAVNRAWTDCTGWTQAELAGRSRQVVLAPEDPDDFAMRVAAGRPARQVFQAAAKDGHTLWLEGSAQRTSAGETVYVLRDVTGDPGRQVDIQDARDAHALQELAGIASWRWDPEDGLALSAQAVLLLGCGRDGSGPDFLGRLHPEDQPAVLSRMETVVREGGCGRYEHRALDSAGRWRRLEVFYKSMAHPSGLYSIQGMFQDVTELADARDAALRGEQLVRGLMEDARVAARRLKLALGAAQAGVFEIDHEGESFWCSPEFVLLLGRQLTYEEGRGVPWPFVHPDDHQRVIDASVVWRTGALMNDPLDLRVVRPDGSVRWMRLYYEMRRDMRGRARRSVGLVLDIDERKRQELALVAAERAAQAAGEAKSRFLASVSHEIRTPMNGILGVLHLLKTETLSADGRLLLEEAAACGQMLSHLINDVLDFSKIEADQMQLHPAPTDPADLLKGVVSLLRPQAEAKGLALTVETAEGCGWVMIDPIRVRQALFNLIGNAVKFTVAGEISVRLHAAAGRLRFEVTDTGIGIPDGAREHLFQRFHQADGSTTRRFGGTGLGLAITRRLAQMMDGEVDFRSRDGQGSTFWLDIAAPAAEAAGEAAQDAVDGLGGLRILVVEDNPTNRLIARKLLEGLGAAVFEAEDGERGVKAAHGGVHDVILMDVQMPGMDGLEATRLIRAGEHAASRTPIIALTANVLTHQKQAYFDAGMDGVVAKPISPRDLVLEIARLTASATASAAA